MYIILQAAIGFFTILIVTALFTGTVTDRSIIVAIWWSAILAFGNGVSEIVRAINGRSS